MMSSGSSESADSVAVTARFAPPHQGDQEGTESIENAAATRAESPAGGNASWSLPSLRNGVRGLWPDPWRNEGWSSGGGHLCPAQGRADLLDGLEACLRPLRQALPAEGVDGLGEAGTEACGRDDRRGADDLGEDV